MSHRIEIPSDAHGVRFENYPSILAALKEERVFDVARNGELFSVEECCDGYYSIRLSAAQLRILAAELVEIADGASDPPA